MEKKKMFMALTVVLVIVAAAIGAVLLMGSDDGETNGVKILTLKKDSNSQEYSPLDADAVYNGSYPLARYLYLYTDGIPTGEVYQWLNFILNESKGQDLASDSGFYPLSSSNLTEMQAQLEGGSPAGADTSITQMGSDTMHELCQLWASHFKNETGISVTITGGGSGLGIAQFVQGGVDVAQASRQIKPSEIETAESNGIDVVEWKVALDGIAIIVNSENKIDSLTMEQLRGIYNGTYTNWNQVGGDGAPIVLYGRNSASGTYDYFKEKALINGEYSSSMQQFSGNSQIVVQVEDNKGGVGYVGIGYAKEATAAELPSDELTAEIIAQVRLED
ncbi:MAG: substrate-binding domain-containing protein [Methanomassiliicoccales archaeon]|jgi:phosphate transport system substrate-binding protein